MPPPEDLIADKAYDADDLRAFLTRQGTRPVISPMPNRRAIPPFDPVAYRKRNLIERAFCRLKDWRAIATLRQNRTKLPRRYLPRPRRHLMDQLSPEPSTTLADYMMSDGAVCSSADIGLAVRRDRR